MINFEGFVLVMKSCFDGCELQSRKERREEGLYILTAIQSFDSIQGYKSMNIDLCSF